MTDNPDSISEARRYIQAADSLLADFQAGLPDPPPVDPPPVRPPPVDPPPVDPPGERFDVFSLRDMETATTIPWKAGDSADSLLLTTANSPYTLADTKILGSTRSGLKTPSGSHYITDVLVASCNLVSGRTLPPAGSGTQWLARCFGVDSWEFKRTWFHDSNHKNEGHGTYLNVCGPLTIRDCLYENLGGNAIQLVWNYDKRVHEGPPSKGGLVRLENIAIRNVSYNPARGSFAIAIYGAQGTANPMNFHLRDLDIDIEWAESQVRSGTTCRSSGGINLRGYSKDSWDHGDVVIENCTIAMKDPFQALAQLGSCRSLVVRNCRFYGGKVDIDHEWQKYKTCGTILWEGNRGDGVVRNQLGEWGPVVGDWAN